MSESLGERDIAAAVQRLTGQVDTVVLAGTDTHGVMRGKRVPLKQLQRLLDHGMPMCDVFWVTHIDESDLVVRPQDHVGYFPTEQNGYPDILAVGDVDTVRIVPWHERTALILCDWRHPSGESLPLDPRGVLARVVERARGLGFDPYCALELEFYVLRETSASVQTRRPADLVPLTDRPSVYGVVMGSQQEPLGRLIRDSMMAYGLPIEACNPETGPGQFEITLEYGPALRAADEAFLFKSGVKELVAQQGLMATFMAKPRSDWAGNSCHVHVSLRGEDGRGAFYDAEAASGISTTMKHFIGGSLRTMAEFSAIFGPTVNSYRRYSPYSWAATTATWGIDNRSTGLRAICEGEGGTRVEHRRGGGDVNPYLAAAAVIAGGMHGIEQRIDPPDQIDGDVYGRAAAGAPLLPASLDLAAVELERSDVARDWFGDDFVSHYVEMKRAECEVQSRAVTDWEVARYLEAL